MMDVPMAPLTVPNRIDPCVGVDISPGCLITKEPTGRITSNTFNLTQSNCVPQAVTHGSALMQQKQQLNYMHTDTTTITTNTDFCLSLTWQFFSTCFTLASSHKSELLGNCWSKTYCRLNAIIFTTNIVKALKHTYITQGCTLIVHYV